jgi:hypothetical protein
LRARRLDRKRRGIHKQEELFITQGSGSACLFVRAGVLFEPPVDMNQGNKKTEFLVVKDCVLIQVAAGVRAQNVRGLPEHLALMPGLTREGADRLEIG